MKVYQPHLFEEFICVVVVVCWLGLIFVVEGISEFNADSSCIRSGQLCPVVPVSMLSFSYLLKHCDAQPIMQL